MAFLRSIRRPLLFDVLSDNADLPSDGRCVRDLWF
jgi:hypothetical protein